MPIEYLASDHPAWKCIYNGDAIGLKGHLREDPSIINKRAKTDFHPGNAYMKGVISFLSQIAPTANKAKEIGGNFAGLAVAIAGVTGMFITAIPGGLYSAAEYTAKAIKDETLSLEYYSAMDYLNRGVGKNFSLLYYALSCRDIAAVRALTAYGDKTDNKEKLEAYIKRNLFFKLRKKDKTIPTRPDKFVTKEEFRQQLKLYLEELSVASEAPGNPPLQQIAELEAQNEKLHARLTALQADHTSQTTALKDEAIRRDREHSQELRRAQSENEHLRSELAELKQVNKDLRQKIETLSKAKAKKESTNSKRKLTTAVKAVSEQPRQSAAALLSKFGKFRETDAKRKGPEKTPSASATAASVRPRTPTNT